MKKICLILLIFALVFSCACRRTIDASVECDEIRTYLVVGFDEVAGNTDVIMLASHNTATNTATIAQIPRDTLCRYRGEYVKLNSVFPRERSSTGDTEAAMHRLTEYLSEAMGVRIDGFYSLDTDTLSTVVDTLGGVDITIGNELSISDEHGETLFTLTPGVNRLDGARAVQFVRYRRGYATGDLGRMDAQKLFLSALIKTVRDRVGLDEATRLLLTVAPKVSTDVGLLETLGFLLKNRQKLDTIRVQAVTVPGEPLMIENKSFYIINRKSTAEMLKRDFDINDGGFDPERVFTRKDNPTVENIYNDEGSGYKYYDL